LQQLGYVRGDGRLFALTPRVLDLGYAYLSSLSLPEIAERRGLNRTTAYRFVYTLRHLGYLEFEPDTHRYRLGPRVLQLGFQYLHGLPLVEIALPLLRSLRDEVGEARERGGEGRGGSSSMTHKRNPVAAVAVVACAQRVPGLVATIHAAMLQEHERAAGAWHAEWETLSDILRLTGAAAAWGREMLEHLEVDRDRIRANLDAAVARIGLEALDLGAADALVDRALAEHKETP